jgi:membrane-bound lytic murein transglycosylase D
MKKNFLLILLLPLMLFSESATIKPPKSSLEAFAVPDRIKNDVDFWAKVYREWDSNQVVFYDNKSKVVYDVLDLPVVNNELSSAKYKKDVDKRMNQIVAVLKSLSYETKIESDDAYANNIKAIVKLNGLSPQEDLLTQLRAQNGLRRQFEQGLRISGRYMDDMKAILKSQDLPEDLLAIVFVESLFNLSAVSHAGASGPWGIVKETAVRSGIHVNNFTDERLDWVMATFGAAQFLKRAKEGLTEWPLAITAYNYGYPGMMRAVNNFGKDFEAILDNHTSPIFGYASKSYYAEFLAALDTLRDQEKYFPGLKKDGRCTYDTVQVKRPLQVDDLLSLGIIRGDDLKNLNPALTKRTINGHEVIPANYVLRVPPGKETEFYQQLKKIGDTKRSAASSKISAKHKARPHETLLSIAKLFGISEEYLSNKMGKPLNYKPKGTVLIRSEAHRFKPLTEFNEPILSLAPIKAHEKPAKIQAKDR